MMQQTIAKVKIDDLPFQQLMLDLKNGKIRIPDFQREFVWEQGQIVSLLDSIYHHYPVGSFLFWRTREEIASYRTIGDCKLDNEEEGLVHYVLDGQQRITSLFACLEEVEIEVKVHGKTLTKRLDIHFDLDQEVFVADPFGGKEGESVYKPKRLLALPGVDDYLAFLRSLDAEAEAAGYSKELMSQWISAQIQRSPSTGLATFNDCYNWGLFGWSEGHYCRGANREAIYQDTPVQMLDVLSRHIAWFELLLDQLMAKPETTEAELREAINSRSDQDIDGWYLWQRILWLQGLRIVDCQEAKITVTAEGHAHLHAYQEEREYRQQLQEEREKSLRQRFLSVKQITSDGAIIDLGMELGKGKRFDALKRVVERFKSYPFSVIYVLDQPIDIACEIFERINNSGKILNLVDLMVAKCYLPGFNLREKMLALLQELRSHHYGEIPEVTVLQSVAAILGKSIKRKDILNLDKERVADTWDAIVESLRKAVDFLKSSLNLTDSRILPYNSLLVPLAYFFYYNGEPFPSDQQAKRLLRWFWLASFTSRYDSAVETKIGDDIEQFDAIIAGNEPAFEYGTPAIDEERIINQKLYLGSAFCKSMLCLFTDNRPLEWENNIPVQMTAFSKFNSAQLHHIFPQAYLNKHAPQIADMKDSIANIALASSALNRKYRDKAPSVYLQVCGSGNEELKRALESHLIGDLDSTGLSSDDYETFLNYRAERILHGIRARTGQVSKVEIAVAKDEKAAVEEFELRLRALIANTLATTKPDYWEHLDPEFRQRVESRVNDHMKAHPSANPKEINRLDFFQIRDYFKVIKANWPIFETVFGSKTELEKHLANISDFRNGLMHSREIGRSTRKLAEGSLIWFAEVFEASGSLHAPH